MKLCFSIDALAASGDRAWRLLADESHWRPCTFAETLRADDACLTDRATLQSWTGRRLVRDRELLLKPRDKPGRFDFLMRGIFAHAIVHRMSAAPMPAMDDLQRCLATASPGTPWLIYLDLAGHFRAMDTQNSRIIGNPDIAVRGEIASAEGYVGEAAANDTAYVARLYQQFLAGWRTHLDTRRTGIFVPDIEKAGDLEAIRAAILAWEPESCASSPPT